MYIKCALCTSVHCYNALSLVDRCHRAFLALIVTLVMGYLVIASPTFTFLTAVGIEFHHTM